MKAQDDTLTLGRARLIVRTLGEISPSMSVRIINVAAGKSELIRIPLTRVKNGNIFIGRIRTRLLSKAVSFTIRDLGSIPTHLPRKLAVITAPGETGPFSYLV